MTTWAGIDWGQVQTIALGVWLGLILAAGSHAVFKSLVDLLWRWRS